jgi:hypothetical protein
MNELFDKNDLVKCEDVETKNRLSYLSIIDRYWEFDKDSREYIVNRLSPNFKLAPEYQKFIDQSHSNDLRVRWTVDFSNKKSLGIFEKSDEGYRIFLSKFGEALRYLRNSYDCNIGYEEYINNKAIFCNNPTKIKKILMKAYADKIGLISEDLNINSNSSSTTIENTIIKIYERIGTVKKSKKEIYIVLSFNPIDWLLASTENDFTSCLDISKSTSTTDGMKYFAGLPFLCGDPNRAMIYLCNGTKKEFRGIVVDKTITRSWISLDNFDNMQLVKWYQPNEYFTLNELKDLTGITLSEVKTGKGKYPIKPLFLKDSKIFCTIYQDTSGVYFNGKEKQFEIHFGEKTGFQIYHKSGVNVSSFKNFNLNRPAYAENFGYNLKSFDRCGSSFDNIIAQGFCSSCGKKDALVSIKSNKDYECICIDCYSALYKTCSFCNVTFKKEEMVTIKDVIFDGILKDVQSCPSCSSSIKRYKCEECGKYIYNQGGKIQNICDICLEDPNKNFLKCSTCGKILKKDIANYYDPFEKTLTAYCLSHAPDISYKWISIYENDLSDIIKPYVEKMHQCPTCHNFTSFGEGCNCRLCTHTHGHEMAI